MADPASHSSIIPLMTEELKENKFRQKAGGKTTNQMTLFPEPATQIGDLSDGASPDIAERNARFPWIHNREPVCFHSITILP
jgi:hypothetical protein